MATSQIMVRTKKYKKHSRPLFLQERSWSIIIFQSPSDYQKWSFVNSFLMGPPVTLPSLYIMVFCFWRPRPKFSSSKCEGSCPDSPCLAVMNRYIFSQLRTFHPTCDSVQPKWLWQACKATAKPGVPPSFLAHQQIWFLRHPQQEGTHLPAPFPRPHPQPAASCSGLVAAASGCCRHWELAVAHCGLRSGELGFQDLTQGLSQNASSASLLLAGWPHTLKAFPLRLDRGCNLALRSLVWPTGS